METCCWRCVASYYLGIEKDSTPVNPIFLFYHLIPILQDNHTLVYLLQTHLPHLPKLTHRPPLTKTQSFPLHILIKTKLTHTYLSHVALVFPRTIFHFSFQSTATIPRAASHLTIPSSPYLNYLNNNLTQYNIAYYSDYYKLHWPEYHSDINDLSSFGTIISKIKLLLLRWKILGIDNNNGVKKQKE